MQTETHDSETSAGAPARRLFDRVCRNPRTGRVALVQRPNLPLTAFLLATAVRVVADPSGGAGAVVSAMAIASLTWWSVEEILRGDSLFRRGLGAAVLIGMIAQWILPELR